MIQKMQQFNRERVPERMVHAKGGRAFGFFETPTGTGLMRYENPSDPVYAPNSLGGPVADPARFGTDPSWSVTGEIVRAAYEAHREDDDFVQANAMVNTAMDEGARDRLVSNIVGHVSGRVSEPVLSRVFEYWHSVDKSVGDRVEQGVRKA